MGYRSEVVIAFRSLDNTVGEEWASLLIKQPEFMKALLADDWLREETKCDVEKNTLVFNVDHVKWYESYAQVITMTALWDYFEGKYNNDGDGSNFMGLFIRVGEETGDIEEKHIGDGYELGYVTSAIELNI